MDTSHSNQVTTAVDNIRNHRLRGEYSEGNAHIGTLSSDVQHDPLVVMESAYLYLVQGKFRHAMKALDSCFLSNPAHRSSEDELMLGCLTLMKGYTIIQRQCKIFTAWDEAVEIRKTLLESGLDFIIDPEVPETPEREATENLDDDHTSPEIAEKRGNEKLFSRLKVFLVFWYYKIASVAAEQAVIDPSRSKTCARQHLQHVMSVMRSQRRVEEERMLLQVYIDTLSSPKDKIRSLSDFLVASNGNDLQQALTYLDLASCSIEVDFNSQEHLQHLMQASLMFSASEHRHGQLDTSLLWISKGQEHFSHVETALKKVRSLREISKAYAKQDYPLGEIRALSQATQIILLFPEQPELDAESYEIDSRLAELSAANDAIFIYRIHCILTAGQSLKHEVDSGSSLQALELMFEENRSEPVPKIMGMISHMIAACYDSLGNYAKALEYQRRSLKYHKMGKDYIDISDSVFMLVFSVKNFALKSASRVLREELQEAIELLEQWAVKDEGAGYLEGASDKYQELARLELYRHQLLGVSGAWEKFISWREKLLPCQHVLSESLIALLPVNLMLIGNYNVAAEFLLEILQYFRAIGTPQEKIAPIEMQLSICFLGMAEVAKKQALLGSDNLEDGRTEDYLDELQSFPASIKILESLFAFFESSKRDVSMTISCAVILARAHRYLKPNTGSEVEKAAVFRKVNEFFSKAESQCDELRQQVWTFGGLQALLDKRQIVSKETHRSLYSEVLVDCLKAGEISSAWVWVQKGKARGLADMLGSQYSLPLVWLEGLEGDQDALELMAGERQLVDDVSSAKTPSQPIARRRLLKAHQAEMRKHPVLSQYLSAREGAFDFISLDSIFDSFSSAYVPPHSKIVLIDWVILEGGRIAMITVDSRKQPVLYQLGITINVVEKWLKDHFRFLEGEEPDLHQTGADRILSKLSRLVEKLEECTNENDLLILSPTGLLHQLPLHALQVGGRILLDRNLVVYSSSLSVLRSCLNRSETKITESSHRQSTKSIFLGVYEEEDHFAERRYIFDCVKSEAKKASASYSLGPEVTRMKVIEATKEADWIHFHGHARYDGQNILEQGLVLSDGVDIFLNYNEVEEEEEEEEQDGSGDDTEGIENSDEEDEVDEDDEDLDEESHEDLFQIADIFTLKLNATHLTLIACESGVQQIEPGDEPLGIVSAFLVAGAASTVGTLWPTLSPAGRAFTEAFYENLRRQKEEHMRRVEGSLEDTPVVSLAVALREAVRSVRANPATSSPYCWAPFVLHGAWFCRAI